MLGSVMSSWFPHKTAREIISHTPVPKRIKFLFCRIYIYCDLHNDSFSIFEFLWKEGSTHHMNLNEEDFCGIKTRPWQITRRPIKFKKNWQVISSHARNNHFLEVTWWIFIQQETMRPVRLDDLYKTFCYVSDRSAFPYLAVINTYQLLCYNRDFM